MCLLYIVCLVCKHTNLSNNTQHAASLSNSITCHKYAKEQQERILTTGSQSSWNSRNGLLGTWMLTLYIYIYIYVCMYMKVEETANHLGQELGIAVFRASRRHMPTCNMLIKPNLITYKKGDRFSMFWILYISHNQNRSTTLTST